MAFLPRPHPHSQEELSRVLGPMADGNEAPKADRIAVLAIAYHNVGVEYEFLKKFDQSLGSYLKGVEVSERFLGPDHAITVTLRNSCIAARRAIMVRDPQARLKTLEAKHSKRGGGGSSGARGGGGGGGRGKRGGGGKATATAEGNAAAMISPRPPEGGASEN